MHEQHAGQDTKSHWKEVLAWGVGSSVVKVSGFPTVASPDQMRPPKAGILTCMDTL